MVIKSPEGTFKVPDNAQKFFLAASKSNSKNIVLYMLFGEPGNTGVHGIYQSTNRALCVRALDMITVAWSEDVKLVDVTVVDAPVVEKPKHVLHVLRTGHNYNCPQCGEDEDWSQVCATDIRIDFCTEQCMKNWQAAHPMIPLYWGA